jgi:hypothetical protein
MGGKGGTRDMGGGSSKIIERELWDVSAGDGCVSGACELVADLVDGDADGSAEMDCMLMSSTRSGGNVALGGRRGGGQSAQRLNCPSECRP